MLFHTLPVYLAFLRKDWDRCKIFILQRPLVAFPQGESKDRFPRSAEHCSASSRARYSG